MTVRTETTLRIGTRRSALAKTQTRTVADALAEATGATVELVEILTPGDRSTTPVPQLGVGVFVSALREALAAKEIDLAVHSYKDLPTGADPRLAIAAVPPREDPRDVLAARDGHTLATLPAGAHIGTGSPRRAAQLRVLGRGLEPVPVRGNVDTRLATVADGQLDAVVLARAGLARLGRTDAATETLDPAVMLPAPAQGALAVERRAEDDTMREVLAALDHPPSRLAVAAERALLATLEAGCSAPVAGLAEFLPEQPGAAQGELRLHAAVVDPDGDHTIRRTRATDGAIAETAPAELLGQALATELLDAGAGEILARGRDDGAAPAAGSMHAPQWEQR